MKFASKTTVPIVLSVCLLSGVVISLEGCRGGVKALWAKFHHRKSQSRGNTTDYADNVAQVVSAPHLDVLKWANYTDYQPQVQQFYEGRNYEIAWSRDGRPTPQATAMIQLFKDAAQKGLRPEDYDSSRWPEMVQGLSTRGGDEAQNAVAKFDAAMTISTMRYAADLHFGRINPQALNFDIDVPARRAGFDMAGVLDKQLVDADDVPAALAKLEPQNSIYQATEQALARYIEIAEQQASQPQEPLPEVGKSVGVGGVYAALPALAARLQLEGDGNFSEPPLSYNEEVATAVKHFQDRHGLTPDGKLSQGTVDAMNVPMQTRVQQLNDSLERWRWLPEQYVQPRLMVNLAEYVVRAYDADGNLAFKMRTVNGEAKGHDTPMFVRTMKYMIFRPYWNLPVSIVKKELLRHVNSSGAAYMERNNYEVVNNKGQLVNGWTANDLEHSRYLVRQKPGPKNSLGLVKFMFPNEYDIYMHSTPEMHLFNLARRDRSHGCVRLNDAEKMANWVLSGQGSWDEDKVHEAIYGPTDGSDPANNKQVNLQTQLPVVLTYLTANADEDGTVHFFRDVYGYDRQLEAALEQPRPYSMAVVKINPKLTPGETE